MLSQALATLDRSHDTLDLEYLDIPTQRKPKVSIIIPAHNKVRVTYYCLCSILVAYNKTSFEVIVVDDGSTDDTNRLEVSAESKLYETLNHSVLSKLAMQVQKQPAENTSSS